MHKANWQGSSAGHFRRATSASHLLGGVRSHSRWGHKHHRVLALAHYRHAHRAFGHLIAQTQNEPQCFFQDSLLMALLLAGFVAFVYLVVLFSGMRLLTPSELPGYPGLLV